MQNRVYCHLYSDYKIVQMYLICTSSVTIIFNVRIRIRKPEFYDGCFFLKHIYSQGILLTKLLNPIIRAYFVV